MKAAASSGAVAEVAIGRVLAAQGPKVLRLAAELVHLQMRAMLRKPGATSRMADAIFHRL